MIHSLPRPARRLVALLAVMFAMAPFALASRPVTYELESRADLEKGEADRVSIADDGSLALAPASDVVFDTGQTYVWSSAADASGQTYLGTGPEGKLYAVNASGAGREIFDAAELNVTALAVDPSGTLFAATSPDGKVYRVGPDGKAQVYFEPGEKYIWSLAVRGGALFVGTGEKGIIYRVSGQGAGTVWCDTDELHVVALDFAPGGNLFAGTDPGGLVLRIGADGKPFVLFDAPLQEMHAVRAAADGSVLALGIAASAATTAAEQGGVSTVDSVVTTVASPDLATLGTADVKSRRDTSDARSAVYRIGADGTFDVLWSSKTVVGYAIHPEATRVLVGTGDRGRILAVDWSARATLLLQTYEDQTSTFVETKAGLRATSNTMGRLFKVGPERVAKGTYESPVHDAKSTSAWGQVAVRDAVGATVETRSGNTETPDSTWSAWSPVPVSNGRGLVASPSARYLQWRITLAGNGARLGSSAVSYLPRNIAPEVTTIAVFPTGIGLQETPTQAPDPGIVAAGFDPAVFGLSGATAPRKVYQKGARSLLWQGKDGDDEKLAYTLSFRTLDESAWHVLATGLTTPWYTVDSDALPDGMYVFRVTADDSPSNPLASSLTGARETEPVDIDNTAPAVTAVGKPSLANRVVEAGFRAADGTTRLTRAEYSLDGGPWTPVFSEDGIVDSPIESFRVRIPGVADGEHSIALRATDASLNVGSEKVTVVVSGGAIR